MLLPVLIFPADNDTETEIKDDIKHNNLGTRLNNNRKTELFL